MKTSIVRGEGEGEKTWFYGGGIHIWKVTAEETNGAFFVLEDEMVRGKTTPLHKHPDCDEFVYVLEGEILAHGAGVERRVGKGGIIFNPRGVEHAFIVVSETARTLSFQTPGSAEAFYRRASEPLTGSDQAVDFKKIKEAAQATGATVILGPPPFAKP